MSWPYLKAATELRLPAPLKIVALALGDFAEVNGTVCASNARIRRWTGQSHQTVRQLVRELVRRQLASSLTEPSPLSAARFSLHYPGALETRAPLDSRDLKVAREVLKDLEPNDRSLIPSNKSRKASRGRELPTNAQIQKLVHVVIEDPHTQITEDGDLVEMVKRACSQAGFEYHPQQVTSAINQVLAARGRPPLYRELKGQRR